jgi:hypothetical protein
MTTTMTMTMTIAANTRDTNTDMVGFPVAVVPLNVRSHSVVRRRQFAASTGVPMALFVCLIKLVVQRNAPTSSVVPRRLCAPITLAPKGSFEQKNTPVEPPAATIHNVAKQKPPVATTNVELVS